jgi:regulator of sigma E protease
MITQPVVIEEVVPGTPAAAAGFRPGDAILSVHGRTVENIPDMQRFTHLYLGDEINIVVKGSDGVNRTLMVVPRWNPPPGQGAMGIKLDINAAQAGQKTISESEPFWRAIPAGFRECIDAFVLFKNEVITWFSGTGAPQVVGPVGMAELTGEVARAGFSPLLQWAAFISINLGIVNLIPLPALDGGRIFFVLLEIVRRGKRVSPKTEGLIHLIGFVLLIGLMILVTYRDIFNIITGGSAIP